MSTHFADQLVLARWGLKQIGIDDFDRLSTLLRSPEYEGWSGDGGSLFAEQLIARLPRLNQQGRTVSDEMLREYDGNIVRHWKHITRIRNLAGPTIYPLYFQYLCLLVSEIYLDGYFRDPRGLLQSLNGFPFASMLAPEAPAPKTRGKKKTPVIEIEPFTLPELNKLAFWMATGSGKTLLMHCHIL
ncbi:MAG: hypothetical protein ACKV2V_07515 [Blastocatellia bacterium]